MKIQNKEETVKRIGIVPYWLFNQCSKMRTLFMPIITSSSSSSSSLPTPSSSSLKSLFEIGNYVPLQFFLSERSFFKKKKTPSFFFSMLV